MILYNLYQTVGLLSTVFALITLLGLFLGILLCDEDPVDNFYKLIFVIGIAGLLVQGFFFVLLLLVDIWI